MNPIHPDVTCNLIGNDGNAFAIIGAVTNALRKAGYSESAARFSEEAFASESYDALLQLVMRWVEVS